MNDANTGKCRSCGAAIIWVLTPKGKRMPLDAEVRARGVTLEGIVTDVRSSHFETCPDADAYRRRGA